MRAVLVDPENRSILEIETDGQLKSLQALVEGYIEGIYPAYADSEWEGVHGYVDEEFLYSGKDARKAWSVPGYPHLLGPGVFLGSTPSGEEDDCPMSVMQIYKHVTWHF